MEGGHTPCMQVHEEGDEVGREIYPRWRVWPLAPGIFLFPDHELTWYPGSWKVMCQGLVWEGVMHAVGPEH